MILGFYLFFSCFLHFSLLSDHFRQYCADCLSHHTDNETWCAQVFRSIDYASAKFSNEAYKSWFMNIKAHGVEQSIYWNYIYQINRFIIENCIFIFL